MGRDARVLWQGLADSGVDEGGGRVESVVGDTRTSKNDQITLGRPLGSGYPNMGILQVGGKSGIADFDQCGCQDRGCSGLKRRSKRLMKEA